MPFQIAPHAQFQHFVPPVSPNFTSTLQIPSAIPVHKSTPLVSHVQAPNSVTLANLHSTPPSTPTTPKPANFALKSFSTVNNALPLQSVPIVFNSTV